VKTRDHTERMLKAFGCPIKQSGNTTSVTSLQQPLETFELAIPGDPSTAAFFAAAAALIPKSELILKNVLANPTRSGFFGALEKMGAGMECLKKWDEGGDEVQNLKVSERPLTGITITSEQVPALIDELPILAVVATQAEGRTEVRGAGELRVKECDRLSVICTNLHRMGADVMELPDGFIITGPTQLRGAQISTFNDHRIAMAFTIAGHIAHESIELDDLTCVNISCPEFTDMLRKVIT